MLALQKFGKELLEACMIGLILSLMIKFNVLWARDFIVWVILR